MNRCLTYCLHNSGHSGRTVGLGRQRRNETRKARLNAVRIQRIADGCLKHSRRQVCLIDAANGTRPQSIVVNLTVNQPGEQNGNASTGPTTNLLNKPGATFRPKVVVNQINIKNGIGH